MAKTVISKRGKEVTLLNPWEKGNKYFMEMTSNQRLTNDYEIKNAGAPLTDVQKAYRAGYLAAQRDSRKAFKSKHPRYKNKIAK